MKVVDACSCGSTVTIEGRSDIAVKYQHQHWLIDHRVCREAKALAVVGANVPNRNQEG